MRSRTPSSPSRRWRILALGVTLLLVVPGYVVGASLKVTKGTTENGRGMYLTSNGLGAWWTPSKFAVSTVPTPLPGILSTSSATPSVLSNTTQPMLDQVGSAGESALLWQVSVTTGAPVSTEIELTFNVSLGSVPLTQLKVYIETNGSAPGGPITYRLYYPFSAPAPTAVAIQAMSIEAQLCVSIGRCP